MSFYSLESWRFMFELVVFGLYLCDCIGSVKLLKIGNLTSKDDLLILSLHSFCLLYIDASRIKL